MMNLAWTSREHVREWNRVVEEFCFEADEMMELREVCNDIVRDGRERGDGPESPANSFAGCRPS